MWRNKKKWSVICTECHTRLPVQAEACPDCGYPVTALSNADAQEDPQHPRGILMEYKLIKLFGIVVFSAGVTAAIADSPIAATVAIMIGGATYVTGLLGAWWNSGD